MEIYLHRFLSRCVWGNFSQWTTEKCHKANPSVGLLFSMPRFLYLVTFFLFHLLQLWNSFMISKHGRFVKLYLLFYTGLLPFVPLKETHLEIPMPSIFYDNNYRLCSEKGNSFDNIFSEHLGPMLDLENCPCGPFVWRTMS